MSATTKKPTTTPAPRLDAAQARADAAILEAQSRLDELNFRTAEAQLIAEYNAAKDRRDDAAARRISNRHEKLTRDHRSRAWQYRTDVQAHLDAIEAQLAANRHAACTSRCTTCGGRK